MSEITLKINNRGYSLACDPGQEQRLVDLSHYVDSRLRDISAAGAATNESHLLVLTSLVLADEVFELRDEIHHLRSRAPASGGSMSKQDEEDIIFAIEHLAAKIEKIAGRLAGSQDSSEKVRAA